MSQKTSWISREPGEGEEGKPCGIVMVGYMIFWPGTVRVVVVTVTGRLRGTAISGWHSILTIFSRFPASLNVSESNRRKRLGTHAINRLSGLARSRCQRLNKL